MKFERGYSAIALRSPKNSNNVGSALRAAGCYNADLVVVESKRIHSLTDVQRAWKHIPTICTDDVFTARPFGSQAVAVDLVDDATSLVDFVHPERAFYVFGPEDGTLGRETLDKCQHKVYVPTRFCMNLAACVNVILYDRLAKQIKKAGAQ